MKIVLRLYKNCVLNETYQEVFSKGKINNKSILDKYLETLSSYELEIDNAYYENSGEFVFEYEWFVNNTDYNIYDFNYLKLELLDDEDNIKILRYCFIDNIQIKNQCVYLSYKEDIWSSYSDKIVGIQPSYLSRSRAKKYNSFTPVLVSLPFDYDGNNKLDIINLLPSTQSQYSHDVYCVAQLQLYDLVSGDDTKNFREVFWALIRISSSNVYYNSFNMKQTEIDNLMLHLHDGTINGHHFEIGKVYMFPKELINENDWISETSVMVGSTTIGTIKQLVLLYNESSILTGTIQNNYKNLFIGTFDKKIDIINNGTDIDYEVILYETDNAISLKLNCLNQILDITESFVYTIPFQSMLSTEFYQRQIGYSLEKFNLDREQDKNEKAYADDLFDTIAGFANFATGRFSGLSTAWRGFSDIFWERPFVTQQKLSEQKIALTTPKYSNAKGVVNNNSTNGTLREGLIIGRINSDNDNYVKDYINNFGFEVYEFIYDYSKLENDNPSYWLNLSTPVNYNVIKFESANVYGSFTREIANSLNSILTSGVKIWFTETMTNDNYVV